MAEIITMPRLSDTMTEGVVAKWLKQVGDKIEEGDILAEIETDKATMEFESFHEGTLLHIGVHEGETASVDSLLAIIGNEGDDFKSLLSQSNGAAEAEAPAESTPEAAAEEKSSEALATPAGAEVITMPRLSDTMTEGTVAKWLKKVGDPIEEGDILAEIETDKATMEFESFHNGTLLYIGVDEGSSADVDAVLAIIGEKGTDITAFAASLKSQASAPAPAQTKKETAPVAVSESKPAPSSVPAVQPVVNSNGRIVASPLAKKLAAERNINLSHIQGTGEGGRIIKRDIENYTPGSGRGSQAPFVPAGQENFEEVPNSQMRKVIARRLGESKFTAPHYYLNVEFDMDNAIAFRNQYNSIPDTKISFNDIVVKATSLALKEHPQVNSQWFDDKIRKNHHVHIGVAVAVEDGLLVPVLKFADEQSLTQIGSQVKDYAGRARNKKLTPEEMDGSTFTISNLGMFGITDFTSIINQPNSAILSVGAIVQKPVVREGNIVVGNTMKLTLACDHRTVDGATGAIFLQTLKGYIENPVTMLV
ncbi:pyruvate dehydrogenase complex dihydrolipoamide acetyltransferase [Lutimonas halocynthiae]|uniref:pyruvate dehydrogenase complex dihydrolipoamide acetyltransferase n=1 Tax=Lutimonas halocynthiae TaxID=1446477 RepID=UPI0025B38E86|nr:pyruvate dehydrogenase complex dihydrolipoamide acetyltransferase [Lutimonas halocynthiae]MDN3644449.1 pyruvate dehydrogenase complex dihydrolipoamide acetyltransferase [Lutimonas halocynthiae]